MLEGTVEHYSFGDYESQELLLPGSGQRHGRRPSLEIG